MMSDDLVDGDLLTLPRALVEDDRFAAALAAYERVLPVLAANGDDAMLIMGEFETVFVALHVDRLDIAERVYAEMLADLERTGMTLSAVEAFMFPLMFQVARGDTDGVLEALEGFQEHHDQDVTLDEMVSMLQFGAEVHEVRGSPLQAAYLLLSVAEMCEEAAIEHDQPDLGTAVAEAYRDHALLLARTKAQCVLEAESGLIEAPEEAGPEAWRMFLALTLDGATEDDDLLAALTRRVLLSLDASDRWGPASNAVRFTVGTCRVQTFLACGEYESAVVEARRVSLIGDRIGEMDVAHGLRTLAAMLDRGVDGPDFGH